MMEEKFGGAFMMGDRALEVHILHASVSVVQMSYPTPLVFSSPVSRLEKVCTVKFKSIQTMVVVGACHKVFFRQFSSILNQWSVLTILSLIMSWQTIV